METDRSQVGEHAFLDRLRALEKRLIERGDAVPKELTAEEIAFTVYAADHGNSSAWGLYFGPMMSWMTQSGERCDLPSMLEMTPDVFQHWADRARQCMHPVMRARYADLLWEIPQKREGVRPDVVMARIAIDSYLEAVEAKRYDHEVTRIAKAKRALDLALSIGDAQRATHAQNVLLVLDDGSASDEEIGLWGFAYDIFLESPNRRAPLTNEQISQIINDLETRLVRLVSAAPTEYHPTGAEAAARRLANHYRRVGNRSAMTRVLESYGEAVKAMHGAAPPFLAAHSLEELYDLFQEFGMQSQADALNDALRIAGEQSLRDMKSISVEVPLDPTETEKYFATILNGTATEILARIAVQFIPDSDKLEAQMREIAKDAPLRYMIPHVIKDDDGRTIARVGSLETDSDGHLVRHTAQHLDFDIRWLRESFARAVESELITAAAISDFLFASPFYQAKRRAIVDTGLRLYVSGDSLGAIHILIPQLEQAVRQVATAIDAPIYAPRRSGGLHLRTLDELLRDGSVAPALGVNVVRYLRILLTDPRGWNLRNNVCHGLASMGMLSMPVADRVVHAMLVLALYRKTSDNSRGEATVD